MVSSLLSATLSLTSTATPGQLPKVDHILIVEFENTDYAKVLEQPTFKKLSEQGVLFENFYAEVHPSQPNYIAMIAGSTFGYKTDKNINIDDRHIGDLLEEAGKKWKVYAEDYPGKCFLGAKSGKFVRKHVPFLSFRNIQESPERCANIVEGHDLATDLAQNSLPDYALYIPNMDNDGHDTGVAFADNWVANTFLQNYPEESFPENTLVVFTFDESSWSGGNRIYTVFTGPMVEQGKVYNERIDHFDLLKTTEALLGLTDLGKEDRNAKVITGGWKESK